MKDKQAKSDLSLRNWKKIGSPYECVGLTVLVLCFNGEVLEAQREKPAASYSSPNEYFRVVEGKLTREVIDEPLWWDYK